MSPTRTKKSTKKLPQSSQQFKSIESKRSKKRGDSQDGNGVSSEAVQNLETRLEELRKQLFGEINRLEAMQEKQ